MNEAPHPSLRVIHSDYDHAQGVAYNLVLLVWRRRTMPEAYRAVMRLTTEHARQYPRGVGVMHVVETDASVADAASWAAAQNRSIGAPSDARAIESALQSLRRLHLEKYPPAK